MENWLVKRARLTPNRVAVSAGQQQLTFQEVAQAANKLAGQIAALGDDHPRVAVVMTNTLQGYLVIMGLQQLGKTIVFINRRLSVSEINFQLADAEVSLLLTDDAYTAKLTVAQQVKFSELPPGQAVTPVATYPDEFVTSIMYTSGTTSQPKGVMQTYHNHWASAMGSALNLGLTHQDAWLVAVPIFHISGFAILMRSLLYGMRVVLVEKFDAHQINDILIHDTITTMSVVPVMLKQLLADLPEGAHYNLQFRAMLLGGGPTDRTTLHRAQAHHIPIVQSYGMTETASQVVALDPADADEKLGSVGKPLFPVTLRVQDEQGQAVPEGTAGTVWLQSPTLTPGYFNRPELLAKNMQAGWFNTEDYGYLDAAGFLYIQGRAGDMISSGGENIFPDEVESVYAKMPGLDKIVVVGVPDDKWGRVPVAVVEGTALSAAALRQFGREKLAHYKVPQRFYQAKDWHLTASGKVQRRLFTAELNQLQALH